MASDEHFFHVSASHLYVFREVSARVFCPFFDLIICFLGVEFEKFFIDLYSPLSVVSFANIFSCFVDCLFVLLTVSFAV